MTESLVPRKRGEGRSREGLEESGLSKGGDGGNCMSFGLRGGGDSIENGGIFAAALFSAIACCRSELIIKT